jgi:class 3 adenylate cyclase/tetratricopeptide (TPR) repeat protein
VLTCPNCGRSNADDARFCSGCATPFAEAVPSREERKIITVLFADLVGFTSRAELMDPEDVRAMLSPYYSRLRSELERFGGTVEKFIGDAVMALFGAPVAHEDDPERAVRAALAIRDWVLEQDEKLQLRIAVSTGEALISLGARPTEGEGMASGDVVNTTARLQSAAPVNGILVGEQTYRATRHVIDYREAAAVQAKGKAEPVPVWEAIEPRSRLGIDMMQAERTPLVGRENELDALSGALNRAKRERSPQLVTLVGEPGIGKSRLIYELRQTIERGGELTFWRQGRSLPYGDGVAFWALSEMIKAQAGILEGDDTERVKEKLRRAVTALVEDEGDAEWVLGHMRPLIGLTALEGPDNTTERFAAWRRFFESMAERNPMVMVFEDAHWANEELLDFIDHLVDWATGVPLLVVCTARPELLGRRSGWGGGKSNATTISLSPMSDDDTSRIIAAILDRSVMPAETQTRLLSRAGGNPLYAEQFARMYVEVGGMGDLPLPESLQGLIAARLDALSNEEKDLLQEASVVGKVFWLGAATFLTGIDRRRVEEVLHGLERREFLWRARRSSVAGETEYSFRHVLVRDVAYGQLPRGTRSVKHQRAAEWISSLGRPEDHAEMVAHHYEAALELARATGGDTKALEEQARAAHRMAGDKAFGLQAFGSAANSYEKALASWPDEGRSKEELRFSYGNALRHLGDERASHVLTEAGTRFEALGEREKAALSFAALAEYWWFLGRRDRTAENIDRARTLIEGAPPSREKARVLVSVSRFLAIAEQGDRGLTAGREAVELISEFGPEEYLARALIYVALGTFDTDPTEAIRIGEQAQSLALASKSADSSVITGNLSVLYATWGDFRRSDELFWKAVELEARLGDSPVTRHTRAGRTMVEFNGARWDEAMVHADAFIAEIAAGRQHYNEWVARMARAHILLARDDVAGALADMRRAIEVAREAGDFQVIVPALSFAAWTEFEAGNTARAGELIDEVIGYAVAGHIQGGFFFEGAWVAEATGRGDALRGALTQIAWRSPMTETVMAILDRDWRVVVERFGYMGLLVEEARARLRFGEALITEGNLGEAVEQIEKALAFYRSVRATRYIRRGEALIEASSA